MRNIQINPVVYLILVSTVIASENVFNISSDVDKDELWSALLRYELPSVGPDLKDDGIENNYDANSDDYTTKEEEEEEEAAYSDYDLNTNSEPSFDTPDRTIQQNDTNNDSHVESSVEQVSVEPNYATANRDNSHVLSNLVEPLNDTRNDKRDAIVEKVKYNRPKPGQTSLVIVFDSTGSMAGCLMQLRSGAKEIVEKFAQQDNNPIYNYIFVPYRDPRVGPKVVTTDKDVLLKTLNELTLEGGGDCPELAIQGISLALESALPKSFVYIFSDAAAKDFLYESNAITQIQRKQATLTFLLTGYCGDENAPGYKVFQRLAAISNGQVYNLETRDIKDVLDDIKNSMDKRRITLNSIDSPTSDENKIDVTVDKNVDELKVIVSGSTPNIAVFDPNKVKYENATETLNLDNLKEVKVENPQPGQWKVETIAESPYTVRLTALSNVIFNFGFSLNKPRRILETSYSPLIGHDNILSISPSNRELITNLTTVQIVSFEEKGATNGFSFALDLQKISGNSSKVDEDVYSTRPFQPPRSLFKIYVNGFDQNGNPLQRLLSTVIQSTRESPPQIFIDDKVIEITESEEFTITCHVDSLIPVRIEWKHHDVTVAQLESNQTSYLDYNVPVSGVNDQGVYTCIASNTEGADQANVTVNVLKRPLTVSIPLLSYDKIENQSQVEIPCIVSAPKSSVKVVWFQNSAEIDADNVDFEMKNSNLIIKNLSRMHQGYYTCEAITANDQTAATTYLNVLYAPILLDPPYEEITVKYDDELNLNCRAEGEPPVTIEWRRTDQRGEYLLPLDYFPVESFQEEHDGEYVCDVSNEISMPIRRYVRVRGEANSAPRIRKTNDTVIEISTGSDFKLNCSCRQCQPLTSAFWTRRSDEGNEQQMQAKEMANTEINQFSMIMELLNVTKSDEGTYECSIANEYGSDSMVIDVKINQLPKIRMSGDDENQSQSSYVQCDVNGTPTLVTKWTSNETKILSGHELYIASDDSESDTTQQRDEFLASTYKCSVFSPSGFITRNLSVLVAVPLLSEISKESELITATEGTSVHLPCSLSTLHAPQLTWLLNGHELPVEKGSKYTSNGEILEFIANSFDSGIYECRAALENATLVSKDIVLVIFVKPRIYARRNEVIQVVSNGDAILKCDAVGFPMPNITWSFEGNLLTADTNSSDELIIRNVTKSNEGAYVCDAFNDVGLSQNVFYIVVNDRPTILSSIPSNITMNSFESREINCTAIGNPQPKTYWLNSQMGIESNSVLLLNANATKTSIETFTCVAENSVGKDMKTVSVTFLAKPRFLTEVAKVHSNVLVGKRIDLMCPFENYESIEWFLDGKLLKRKSYSIHSNQLIFDDVQRDYQGNYTCRATNAAGHSEHSFEVTVVYPPEILDDNDELASNSVLSEPNDFVEVEVMEDSDLKLVCLVNGSPKPRIQWIRNGIAISTNETLTLSKVTVLDEGIYLCNATNDHGSDEKMYKIRIFYPPMFDGRNEIFSEVTSGEDITLNCSMQANPAPFFKWLKNGQRLDENQETLVISSSTLGHNGTYTCNASNAVGSKEMQFHVEVFQSPKIEPTPERIMVLTSSPLNLTCQASGNPLPIVSWLRNGRIVASTSQFQPEIMQRQEMNFAIQRPPLTVNLNKPYEVSLQLEYHEVKKRNSGTFTCVATNAIGKSSQDTIVETTAAPKFVNIKPDQTHLEVLEGLPIFLDCPAGGEPKPVLLWLKDNAFINDSLDLENVKILNDGRHLSIIRASIQDAGTYECLAQNSAGSNSLFFNVSVLVPPRIVPSNHEFDSFEESDDVLAKTIVAVHGTNVALECPVFGSPEPFITWVRIEYSGSDEVTREILDESNLVLQVEAIANGTTYLCYANSTIGNVEYLFHIEVEKPLTILDEWYDKKVSVHLGFTLHCNVSGNPEPTVHWYKDESLISTPDEYGKIMKDKFISTDGKLLRIISSTMEHNGEFTCVATNRLGTAYRHFDIEIYDRVHWSPWEQWSACSTSCGKGQRVKQRRCIHQNGTLAQNNDLTCRGKAQQIEDCENMPCPVNGEWSDWSEWTNCSLSCVPENQAVESKRVRYRQCDSPAPAFGGKPCIGLNHHYEVCQVPKCLVHGNWSSWSSWSSCSVTCGKGHRQRFRLCDNPAPKNGGQICIGPNSERKMCNHKPCAVNGGWSSWSKWSACSRTCGKGQKYRHRECNSPKPWAGGLNCTGASFETASCELRPCKYKHFYDQSKNLFTPLITLDESQKTPLYGDDAKDYYELEDDDYNDALHQFAEGRPEELVTLPKSDELFSKGAEKVIVRVENVMPLSVSNDLAQISINLQNNDRSVPMDQNDCSSGYEYNALAQRCVDIDECSKDNVCPETQTCINTPGSFECKCAAGFVMQGLSCVDINECLSAVCSHYCKNLAGNFECSCPSDMKLGFDNTTCVHKAETSDHFSPLLQRTTTTCREGFQWKYGECSEIDECAENQHRCSEEQLCVNIIGAYLCVPKLCPANHSRHADRCIHLCTGAIEEKCPTSSTVAHTINYLVRTIRNESHHDTPILKLINYDIAHKVLEHTKFIIDENSPSTSTFKLENVATEPSTSNLFANQSLDKGKLYKIQIVAFSYDSSKPTANLIYLSDFIVYIYVL